MELKYSGEIVLLTENESVEDLMSSAPELSSCRIYRANTDIYRFSNIRRMAEKNKNLFFLRNALTGYVQERGVPLLVIVDFQNDLSVISADRHLVLKTVLVTFLLLGMSRMYENLILNLFVVYDSTNADEAELLSRRNGSILTLINSSNEQLNSRINFYRGNATEFNSRFSISFSCLPSENPEFIKNFYSFLQLSSGKIRLLNSRLKNVTGAASNTAGDPASAEVIIGDELVINGSVSADGKKRSYTEKNLIFIKGLWNSSTNRYVLENIKKSAAVYMKSSVFDGALHFIIDDNCRIDGIVAASITQLTVNEFKDVKCRYSVSDSNYVILTKSSGFALIKKNIYSLKN